MAIEREHGQLFEFGSVQLDPSERLCLRNGQVLPLTPKAFDLLVYLVERHGHLVEKQALMHAMWPDSVVEDANLAYTVSMLRKALDDDADSVSVIQTVPTRGYRFVAPVKVSRRMQADSTSDRRCRRARTASRRDAGRPAYARPPADHPGAPRRTLAARHVLDRRGPGRRSCAGAWILATVEEHDHPGRAATEHRAWNGRKYFRRPKYRSHSRRMAPCWRSWRGRPETRPQLHVRRLDQLTAMPLSGTDGASTPCFLAGWTVAGILCRRRS